MPETLVQPYLYFGGRCQEALDFYKGAVGAQVEMVMKFSESPEPVPAEMLAPGFEHKVMHSSFRVGGSVVMASDGCDANSKPGGFALALSLHSEAEAHRAFNALAVGGQVKMPLSKTFWSPCFGSLVDQFGIEWMVMVVPAGRP